MQRATQARIMFHVSASIVLEHGSGIGFSCGGGVPWLGYGWFGGRIGCLLFEKLVLQLDLQLVLLAQAG